MVEVPSKRRDRKTSKSNPSLRNAPETHHLGSLGVGEGEPAGPGRIRKVSQAHRHHNSQGPQPLMNPGSRKGEGRVESRWGPGGSSLRRTWVSGAEPLAGWEQGMCKPVL